MQMAQGRKFGLGFYQDMGDDASDAATGQATANAAMDYQIMATALATPTGNLNIDTATGASVNPSGSQTRPDRQEGSNVYDFASSAFGSLAKAAGQLVPALIRPGTRTAPPPRQAAAAGIGIGTIAIVGVGAYLVFGGKGGRSSGTKKNPKRGKSKKRKSSKASRKSGKRKGKKKGKR